MEEKKRRFWVWAIASLFFRLVLIYFSENLHLGSRPEVATPLTSLRRLAEGYWLKQSSMSPYAGSMYHGSPLLLSILGPLTVKRIEGQPTHLICSLLFMIADLLTALLIRATGEKLQLVYRQSLKSLNLSKLLETKDNLPAGDIASLIYLWNPLTIVTCVGSSTSPIENLMIALALFGACSRIASLAAFGWILAAHMSLYPVILIIPVILLLGYGPDTPPRKLFLKRNSSTVVDDPSIRRNSGHYELTSSPMLPVHFLWKPVVHFILWATIWASYVLVLCGISVKQYGGLWAMFQRYCLVSSNLWIHSYCGGPVSKCRSIMVGDSALYVSLLGLFINELAEMQFSFFLFCGYVGVYLLSPVMHNLWIWRGTGNANFYFATAIAYACLQIILVVESVGTMLNHDRMLRKQSATALG